MKRFLNIFKDYQFRHFNFRLLIYVFVLTTIGIFVIGSASDPSDNYQRKQIMGLMIGLSFMLIAIVVSYKFIFKFYWIMYAVNAVLLIAVTLVGANHMGAQRWIEFNSFQIQPSEFTKILLFIFLATYIQKNIDNINSFKFLLSVLLLVAFPLLLIYKQPDLSTTIVIFLTFCAIIYLSGLSYKIILGIISVGVPIAIVLLYLIVTLPPEHNILQSYQYKRFVGFYMADKVDEYDRERLMYQQENSVLAIGSGGLQGKGLNNKTKDSVKNGNFLSEPHTDFIFTIVGEELGFIGCASVLLLIMLIVFECIYVGGHASDLQGRLFACGFGCLIAIQTTINVSVVTMLIPNTGLTLPFVSYGLSSLITMYSGIGVVLNIGMQRTKNIYEEVRM